VIVAHQLLKNDIPQHEYWLVTENLLPESQPTELTHWMHWNTSNQQTETGKISFHYTQLSPLKDKILPASTPQEDLSKKTKLVSASKEYNVDVKTLCYAALHFDFRPLWFIGVKSIDEIEHFLPRIGTRHRHVLENGKTQIKYVSSFLYDPENKTTFSETDEREKSTLSFVVDKIGLHTSRLTLEFYVLPNLLRRTFFALFRKKRMEYDLLRSLERLNKVANEIVIPLEF
jgi:hypothetical protein